MQNNKKLPITRSPLFFDDNLFQTMSEWGKDYMETWIGQKVILYQIDRIKTNSDSLYGETKKDEIKYTTPIELPCRYDIKESTNEAYIKPQNNARYKQSGNIEIYMYDETLKEYKCDIKYGDLIGVVIDEKTIFYYEIVDDGKRNFANSETLFGYKRMWRTIKGVEIDEAHFNG